jgi:hypothetical protein
MSIRTTFLAFFETAASAATSASARVASTFSMSSVGKVLRSGPA